MNARLDPEMALLGALLSGYPDLEELPVTAADFDQPAHAMIFDAAQRIVASGAKVDPIRVRFALGEPERLYGGPLYLHELQESCPLPASAPWYAAQVAEAAVKRRIHDLGMSLIQRSQSDVESLTILNDARQLLDQAGGVSDQQTDVVGIEQTIAEVIDEAQQGHRRGLSSPWSDLDRLTRGFYPGRVYVVGARPGIGKSLFASNAAVHAAKSGVGVCVASLEMSRVEWTQRCAAAEAKVDIGRLEEGTLNDDEWERIATAVPRISEMTLDISDSESQTVAGIRAAARKTLRRRGNLGLVVVDYLQLLTAADRKAPRHEQVADISRSLKRLAREFDVPVLALAQVNRASVGRTDKWPTMADLRESGAIEADADQVILLHVDDEEPHLVKARIAKGRSTAKGELSLQMQGHYSRLLPVASQWSPSSALGA